MQFSEWFVKMCANKGVSASEVAEAIGVTPASASYYATGRNMPKGTTLYRIEQYFGEKYEKNDTAKSGAVFGTYDAKLHCITHSAPISMLAHAYGMSSVLLSSAIGVGKARAQELITPFYSATDEEYKKAAEFFEIPLQEMKSGRIELVFNPLVLEKTRQLLLSEHQGD